MHLLRTVGVKLGNRHFLSLSSNVLSAALNVLSFALTARFLQIEEFGQWSVFLLVFGTTDAIRTYIVQTGLTKYISGANESDAKQLVGSGWAILLAITGVFLLFSLPGWAWAAHIGSQGYQLVAKWLGLGLAAILPYNYASWLLQAEQRFDRVIFLRLVSVLSFIVLLVGAGTWQQLDAEQVVWVYIASQLITSLVAMARGWARLRAVAHMTRDGCQKLLDFGKYSVWTGVGSTLLKNSDGFIIQYMLGDVALAIYSLPQKALELMEIPLRSMLGTAIPTMSAQANRNQMGQVAREMVKYAGFLTVAMLPAVLVGLALAEVYVYLIGGKEYLGTHAPHVVRIFILFAFLFPIDRFLGISLDIIGRPALNMAKVLVMLLVNIVGDVVAIYLFESVLAVAAVSILTFLVGIFMGHQLLRRYLDYQFTAFFVTGYAECLAMWYRLRHMARKGGVA
jgi:O-antigen/teichoic acid export membrane protein